MAAKGYMNDFAALRDQFDLSAEQNESTAWYLFRGFRDNFSDRSSSIYKQLDTDMNRDESFDLLRKMIEDNSAGGGDFSIYFPKKGSANYALSTVLFRVDRNTATPAISGMGDMRLSGYLTREDLARERELWELKRENEDLRAAINGPQNFWQQLLQSSMEDGTLKQAIGQVLGTLNNVITGVVMKNMPIKPAVSLQGINGQPVAPNTIPDNTEGSDYPEEMYQFAEYIIEQIGDDPAVQQKFWTNLKNAAIQNPILIQQLLQ